MKQETLESLAGGTIKKRGRKRDPKGVFSEELLEFIKEYTKPKYLPLKRRLWEKLKYQERVEWKKNNPIWICCENAGRDGRFQDHLSRFLLLTHNFILKKKEDRTVKIVVYSFPERAYPVGTKWTWPKTHKGFAFELLQLEELEGVLRQIQGKEKIIDPGYDDYDNGGHIDPIHGFHIQLVR